MKVLGHILLVAGCSLVTLPAQDEFMSLDEIAQAAEEWAQDNLDENLLAALNTNDREKARLFFQRLQTELGGDYVLDLAALKEAARALVPILEQYEETEPYALWLKTRLDYFDVAEELTPPAPKPEPGIPPKRAPNPSPQSQRDAWVQQTRQRPWPPKAAEYVTRLKPILAAERVPAELVWVAEVESSFDPRARSPAGAAGLFQLMPATAKRYGLSTWPTDQRLHPGDSAKAAGKYLKFLHGKFKDWRLALAAYNCGEGTVQTLLAKHQARSFDDIAPFLPAETQLYVPKIEATLLRREGKQLTQLSAPTKGA